MFRCLVGPLGLLRADSFQYIWAKASVSVWPGAVLWLSPGGIPSRVGGVPAFTRVVAGFEMFLGAARGRYGALLEGFRRACLVLGEVE